MLKDTRRRYAWLLAFFLTFDAKMIIYKYDPFVAAMIMTIL